MSQILKTFEDLKASDKKGFIPFVTAGDPDRETSLEIALALARNGADIIELGVPFSDPLADGPTIQASSQRALENGIAVADIIKMVRQIRHSSRVPVVLFSYLNPILRYGVEKLAFEAAEAGAGGVLITDAVDEEAAEIGVVLGNHGLDLISLIAPTTSDDRLKRIAQNARGFLYAVSRAGVTGARDQNSETAEMLVARARQYTDTPIAVGFGISTREQIDEVWRYADAAVVGSAIVKVIENSIGSGNPAANVEAFVRGLLPKVAKRASEI
ncbi:MAG: tryptophan synthase subunit alpha [Acidobacteria bacterium]|nr:MAG: tryptophan synthase subunit alpha [Acidobacteriota bacterium]